MGRRKKTFEKFDFNKDELLSLFNKIKIDVTEASQKVLSSGKTVQCYTVTTKFDDNVVKQVEVSERYEVFDFAAFATDALEKIIKEFKISKYSYFIMGGIQEFRLFSDIVDIDGRQFQKTFYLLNSSDRTRTVNLDYGLYNEESDYHFISKNGTVNKRHYGGITEHIKEHVNFDASVFDEQVELLRDMARNNISLYNVREVVLRRDIDGTVKPSNHTKFDIYKKKIVDLYDAKKFQANTMCKIDRNWLLKPSIEMERTELANDESESNEYKIVFNCLDVFEKYVAIYATRDSFTIKTESEIFLKSTDFYIRQQRLEDILNSI